MENSILMDIQESVGMGGKLMQGMMSDATNLSLALEQMQAQFAPYRRLMAYYSCAVMEIETKFNVLSEEFSLQHDRNPISSIKSRLKSNRSILEKIQKSGMEFSCESVEANLNDVAGIRVICSFLDDIYMLADALLKQDDITLISRKDYIENPKANGYRSLHLIVEVPIFWANEKRNTRAEIQLRTIAMDFWATLEHQMKYKKDVKDVKRITMELRECAEISAQLDIRMNAIRDDC